MARDNDRNAHKSDRELLEELAGRARRTETKVSVISDHFDIELEGTKPIFDLSNKTIWVKTPKVTLEAVMDTISEVNEHHLAVAVRCGERHLMTVMIGEA